MVQATSSILFPPLLLATDGSPSARMAQELLYPIAQALQPGTKQDGVGEPSATTESLVTVITVQPRRSSRAGLRLRPKAVLALPAADSHSQKTSPQTTSQGIATETTSAVPNSPDRLLASIVAEFPAGVSVTPQVRQGRPATEILNCARALQAGLIAVGYRGTSGARELLLGGVSAVIARYAPCSVLVARTATPAPETPRQPVLHHLLLVVDNAPLDRQAIAIVHQLLPAGVQRLTLLYVQPPVNVNYLYGPFVTPNPSWQLNRSLQEAQKEAGEQRLRQVKKAIALPDLDIQTLLQVGEAGASICQVAQQQQVDLVVFGETARQSLLSPLQGLRRQRQQTGGSGNQGRDRRILRNTRLSPTGDYVIHHAPCPVLICRVGNR